MLSSIALCLAQHVKNLAACFHVNALLCSSWGAALCAASCCALCCASLALVHTFRLGGVTPTASDTERTHSAQGQ